MFNNKLKRIMLTVFAVGMLGLNSCDQGLEEMNIDPNRPTSVPAEFLLTQAELSLSHLFWGRALNAEFALLLVQHFAQNEYAEESRYVLSGSSFNSVWSTAYAGGHPDSDNPGGGLVDLRLASEIIQNDEGIDEEVRENQLAIIEVLEVWTFHNLTDIFGDIPYSDALSENPSPVYDSQETIYKDLLTRLDNAVAMMNTSVESFSSGENIYGGNMENWRLLANSLKLRIAMRMSDVEPGLAATAAQDAYNAGVITDWENAALFTFDPQAALANPLYIDKEINKRDDFSVSSTLLEVMVENEDPRIPAYAEPNISGEFRGMPYGLTDAEAFALQGNTSRPNANLRLQQSEAIIIGPVEVYFLLAEAAQKGFIAGDPAEFYEDALRASMEQWEVSTEKAENYIEAHPYDASNWEQIIAEQKWVAMYMQGLQAWAERRRFDYPELPFPEAADPTVTTIPVRAFYPSDEEGINKANLQQVGVNDLSTRLWWDVE